MKNVVRIDIYVFPLRSLALSVNRQIKELLSHWS